MKRAIKFRGKCIDETTDNGKWIVGSLLQDDNGIFMIVCFADHHEQWYRVDPDTLGQFTGLFDRAGKEIYEGDIMCESGTGIFVEVKYEAPEFCYKDNDFGYKFLNHPENFKVIGNIHDNLELLKGDSNGSH